MKLSAISLALFALIAYPSCSGVDIELDVTPETTPEGTGENGGSQENPGNNDTASDKTLIVYYSYTGDCQKIVETLSEQIEADVLRIQPADKTQKYEANNYAIGTQLLNAIKANPNSADSYPAIDPVSTNLDDYGRYIIVSPLWWSQMAAILQTYLFHNEAKMAGKPVSLIVSSHSSGISGVEADAKRLVPEGLFTGTSLWINNSNRSKQDELVKTWLAGLNLIDNNDNPPAMPSQIIISVSGKTLPIDIENNDATNALVAALREAPITYEADDYGGFEKVGPLGRSLPTSDTQITTQAGDVILYSGNQIVLFYGSNTWSYTRLGKMQFESLDELKSFLKAGEGNISVTLSL